MIAARSRPGATAAVIALVTLGGLASPARGAEKRRVAVLALRSGVEQAAGLASRLAERLRKLAAVSVVDPTEARRRRPGIDNEVARCGGDAGCIARLGANLAVDELLIVGISKLGDIVLSLQRLDVAEAKTVGQQSAVLSADEEPDDNQLGLWLRQLFPPELFRRFGQILVTANVDGARVTLNGQARGETPLDGPLKVAAPRTYRVELLKPGYGPFAARIDVPPEATVEVRAELTPDTTAWYRRWYVWAIVGGAVAGAAVGVTAWRLQPDTSQVPAAIWFP